MESSRRPPFDRSRELSSLKKPRLSAEDPRRLPPPNNSGNLTTIGTGLGSNRFRNNANEGVGEVRGTIQQFQQHQELLNQYKTALAELTFNSKPIITNLTIIAGENLQAARAIASTICSHIIEVPSEQKLPSLYLLDSIVKNIGRDYIKFFATRLPEVFCKAYRQVEPPIHSSMRHLFGTWKGVFPPQQLQIIEMELGFSTAVNGSSSGSASSKTDSQTQRQPHSIHVNPKYLQARQRLQQESPPKVIDTSGVDVGSSEDVERPTRTSLQKPRGAGYGNVDFPSGVKRSLTTVSKSIGQGNEKQWLGASGEVEESISTQRNGYDAKRAISNYKSARAASTDVPLLQNPPRSSLEVSKSWKNSEEEEFRWDDLSNRTTDHGAIDKLEFGNHHSKLQTQSEGRYNIESPTEPKDSPFAQPRSSSPSLQQVGTRSLAGLSNFGVPAAAASGAKASLGQQYSTGQTVGPRRPPSAISKRDPRQSLIEKDILKSQSLVQTNPRAALISGQPNTGLRDLPGRNQNPQLGYLPKMQSQTSQKPSSVVSSSEQSHYVPSSLQLSNPEAKLTGIVQKAKQVLGSPSLGHVASPVSSNPLPGDSSEQSNVSNLLAAVMKSGLITGRPISGQVAVQSPATNSPTSRGATISSGPRDTAGPNAPEGEVEKPPVTSCPSNSLPLATSTSAQISKKASGDSNPLSILSTLISKGLISAPKPEEIVPASIICDGRISEQSPTVATNASVTLPPVRKSSEALPAVASDETTPSGPAEKAPDIVVPSAKAEAEYLIGLEFKPPVLRNFHSVVIDRLSEDHPHRCDVCGLCFKLEERLAKHSEWHAFKSSIGNCTNPPSRRWYSNTKEWIDGNAGFPFGYNFTCLSEESSRTGEDNEKMVPADESQCVCLLCGELFEDFYSQERDEWMFKGAVYIPNMSGNTETGPSYESGMHNMIVHCDCMSEESLRELGLFSGIKVEKNT
ncbi:polyadenylation and cleavage factor homolog 4-like [Silene latifolia]|uniref:polyadenylation and cleavage factor homolog 4-like n=1 Tax=Silene latifolia TaxID=37657 RepID=UPI003D77B4BC